MTRVRLRNASGLPDPTAQAALNNVLRTQRPPACVTFEVPIPPSVNHAYITTRSGKRILTDKAKDWIAAARMMATAAKRKHGWRFSERGKLTMHLWAYWPDNRRRDIHNLHKLIADAFEGVLYRDDKWLLIRDEDFAVDARRPRVEVTVREKG